MRDCLGFWRSIIFVTPSIDLVYDFCQQLSIMFNAKRALPLLQRLVYIQVYGTVKMWTRMTNFTKFLWVQWLVTIIWPGTRSHQGNNFVIIYKILWGCTHPFVQLLVNYSKLDGQVKPFWQTSTRGKFHFYEVMIRYSVRQDLHRDFYISDSMLQFCQDIIVVTHTTCTFSSCLL